jgi:uncharacterized membrane protein YdjX (TVP38/TMEM64 family)
MTASRTPTLVAVAAWLALVVAFWWYSHARDLSPLSLVDRLTDAAAGSTLGVVVFFGAYVIRPLLLFPTTLLIVAAGFIFGPLWGMLYGTLATLLSALVGYGIARLFGRRLAELTEPRTRGQRLVLALRQNGFEAVLLSRLLFLPGDLVNYASGFVGVRLRAFTLATALGSLPGLAGAVLFGASFEGDLAQMRPDVDVRLLLSSAGVLLGSLALSLYLRRRRKGAEPRVGGARLLREEMVEGLTSSKCLARGLNTPPR